MPRAPEVSAIVVSYRSVGELERCLTPLVEAGVETVVVDNASNDGSASLVSERFPSIELIESRVNEGFAAANNRALDRVSGEVVLLVNPDCRVDHRCARELAEYLGAHPDVGVVGPAFEDEKGEPVASAHRFETGASVLFMLAGGRTLLPAAVKRALSRLGGARSYEANFERRAPKPVDWVSGACLAVRTDLLRELGGLDDGYFMFMEDEELCRRSWEAGRKVVYVPRARAVHDGGASSQDRPRVWVEFYRSLLRFQALTQPRTYALVRWAVAGRAIAGVALGLRRDAVGVARRRPSERRALAWARIFVLALRASRRRALLPWRVQVEAASHDASPAARRP